MCVLEHTKKTANGSKQLGKSVQKRVRAPTDQAETTGSTLEKNKHVQRGQQQQSKQRQALRNI
jgi:hypothetical protein